MNARKATACTKGIEYHCGEDSRCPHYSRKPLPAQKGIKAGLGTSRWSELDLTRKATACTKGIETVTHGAVHQREGPSPAKPLPAQRALKLLRPVFRGLLPSGSPAKPLPAQRVLKRVGPLVGLTFIQKPAKPLPAQRALKQGDLIILSCGRIEGPAKPHPQSHCLHKGHLSHSRAEPPWLANSTRKATACTKGIETV